MSAPSPVIRFTLIESEIPKILSKSYRLMPEGKLEKHPGGALSSGTGRKFTVSSHAELASVITGLKPNQALTYGITQPDAVGLVTLKKWHKLGQPPDPVPRSRGFFEYPDGPGILMLDHDPCDESPRLDPSELMEKLDSVCPGIRSHGYVTVPSASSHIVNTTTDEDMTGARGYRVLLFVNNGRDIPRAMKDLSDYLWAAGLGFIKLSKPGSMMERTLIDLAVFQPERLDFLAGAYCEWPLLQRRGDPLAVPPEGRHGLFLDTRRVIKKPTEEILRTANRNRKRAKSDPGLIERAAAAKEQWINERIQKECGGDANEELRAIIRNRLKVALAANRLGCDFILYEYDPCGNHIQFTVRQVFENPSGFHGVLTLDPLEPEYHEYAQVGQITVGGDNRVRLRSFAHGGAVYELLNLPGGVLLDEWLEEQKIPHLYQPDGSTHTIRDVARKAGELLDSTGSVFNLAGEVVSDEREEFKSVPPQKLISLLSPPLCHYMVKNKSGMYDPGVMHKDTAAVLLKTSELSNELMTIKMISSAPVLLKRGDELVVVKDRDRESGILVLGWGHPISDEFTVEKARNFLGLLLHKYQFLSEADRSRSMSMLMAPALLASGLVEDRAPVYAIFGDQSQCGKGLLVRILCAIYNLHIAAVTQRNGGVGSLDESLATAIAQCKPLVWLDNLKKSLDSPIFESATTENLVQCRLPGGCHPKIDVRKMLFVLTSNGVLLTPDAKARALPIHIQKQPTETDFFVDRERDMLAIIQRSPQIFLHAIHTLLWEWHARGCPRTNDRRHARQHWCGAMDWIVQNLLDLPPLLDGAEEALDTMARPELRMLRDIALAVRGRDKLCVDLLTADLVEIIDSEGIGVPGLREGIDPARINAVIGRKLGSCFECGDMLRVEDLTVTRVIVPDPKGKKGTVPAYRFERLLEK